MQWNGPDWARTVEHLLQDGKEQVVAVFARVERVENAVDQRVVLAAIDSYCCAPSDFKFQSSYHIELTDEVQARLIKAAWNLDCALVELHSHVGDFARPAFSPSDLDGFEEFVPHVRWRLRGKPYLAIVVTATGFDALAWTGASTTPQTLDCIQLEDRRLQPTNYTLAALKQAPGHPERRRETCVD